MGAAVERFFTRVVSTELRRSPGGIQNVQLIHVLMLKTSAHPEPPHIGADLAKKSVWRTL